MGSPPLLDAPYLVGPPEMSPVLGLAVPLALGSQVAGSPTRRAGAIALVVAVAVVRIEHPTAATALTTVGRDAHDAPRLEEKGRGLGPNHAADGKKKSKKEEGFWSNPPKKMHRKKNQLLNRHILQLPDRR
jgi:hypothetical protein